MPAWLKLTLDTGGQGTIAVGDSVTDGASGAGTVMAQDSTYWYVFVTGGTSWADSGTITKDANNTKPYSAKADTAGLTLTYGSGGTYGGFDRFGRVVDQKWTKSNGPIMDRFEYGYDRASNRIWRDVAREVPGGTTDKDEFYTYDGLHRLTHADRGTLTGTPYSAVTSKTFQQDWIQLETLGNWREFKEDAAGDGTYELDQTRLHNKLNEIDNNDNHADDPEGENPAVHTIAAASGNWVSPLYDPAGNQTLGPRPGSETTAAEGLLCVYDAWNRMVRVYKDNGSGNARTLVAAGANADAEIARYQYDGRGFRIAKLLPHGGPTANADHWDRTDYYYNEDWKILEERTIANVATAMGDGWDESDMSVNAQWVWDVRYIDAAVLRWRDADGNSQTGTGGMEEILYYCNDANRNVTALVDGGPDSATAGAVVEHYVYEPYGKLTTYDANWANPLAYSRFGNPFAFTGRELDPETGLMHYRARTYDPVEGRFKQVDPEEYSDSLNLFAYCASSPLRRLDSSGRSWSQQECETWFSDGKKGYHYYSDLATKVGDTKDARDRLAKVVAELEKDALLPAEDLKKAKDLLAKADEAYTKVLDPYLFFGFMRDYGCKCCALRGEVDRSAVKKHDWGDGKDSSAKALEWARKIGSFAAKRILGKAIPNPDMTGALKAYDDLKGAVAKLSVDGFLHNAITYGEIGSEGCVKFKNIEAKKWAEAVKSAGMSVKRIEKGE